MLPVLGSRTPASQTQLPEPNRQPPCCLLLGLPEDAACAQGLVLQALLLRCVHVLVRMVQLPTTDHMSRAPATCSAHPRTGSFRATALTGSRAKVRPALLARHHRRAVGIPASGGVSHGRDIDRAGTGTHDSALLLGREVVDILDRHPLGETLDVQVEALIGSRQYSEHGEFLFWKRTRWIHSCSLRVFWYHGAAPCGKRVGFCA